VGPHSGGTSIIDLAYPLRVYPYLVRLGSMLPSATEIVCALGFCEQLAGATFARD
jgi:hypothetical protein